MTEHVDNDDPVVAAAARYFENAKLMEDMIVLAIQSAKTLPDGNAIIARAVSRAKAGEEVTVADVDAFFDPEAEAATDISVMVRKGDVLVEGEVESDTLFATFPAGTPILGDPGESYEESLSWLKGEDLLEDDGNGGFKLREAVRFVTPGTAMAMIVGGNKPWTGEDERKIDFRSFDVATVREFVKTGVKVRRA